MDNGIQVLPVTNYSLNDALSNIQTATACTVTTGNASVLSHIAGSAYSIPAGGNKVIVYMEIKIHTTAARSAALGIFFLSVGNRKIKPVRPTAMTCIVNGDGVHRFSGIQEVESTGIRYFTSPVALNANADYYINGVFLGELYD